MPFIPSSTWYYEPDNFPVLRVGTLGVASAAHVCGATLNDNKSTLDNNLTLHQLRFGLTRRFGKVPLPSSSENERNFHLMKAKRTLPKRRVRPNLSWWPVRLSLLNFDPAKNFLETLNKYEINKQQTHRLRGGVSDLHWCHQHHFGVHVFQ